MFTLMTPSHDPQLEESSSSFGRSHSGQLFLLNVLAPAWKDSPVTMETVADAGKRRRPGRPSGVLRMVRTH